MKKREFYYTWWFQIVVIAVVIGSLLIAIKTASPITKINQKVASYNTKNADDSPKRVLSVFLRAVNTENPKLLKDSITPRTLYNYEDEYYNGHITDNNIKDELKACNEALTKQFGKTWFNNTEFIEYGTESVGDDKKYIVKVGFGDNKFAYITSEKVGLHYYVTPITLYEFLRTKEIK